MKKQISVFLSCLFALVFSSCQFSAGTKTDLMTGLNTTHNGFSLDEVYLTDDKNQKLTSNEVPMGTVLQLTVTGVENFTEKNGKVFPGCTILLADPSGSEILNVADAYANLTEGADVNKAKVLTATVNTGNPMEVGKTYKLKVRFFDKENKENEIVNTIDLVMK